MKVLFVNEANVHGMLPMRPCVALMREALTTFSLGEAVLPLRSKMWLPDGSGLLGLMPGYLERPESFGIKVVTIMPSNQGTPYDSHQGVVLLFGVERGEPLAILDAAAITAIRTAAASAAATDALAREDAGDLALLGSGVQARTHLEAMRTVREIRRVRVWSRNRASAERFACEAGSTPASPPAPSDSPGTETKLAIEVAATAEDAVRGADLICTTTSSTEFVLRGSWLAAGAHVNAVGSCFPGARELDTEAVRRARFFTDCRESCLNEAGDFLIAQKEGGISDAHLLGEIGEVFLGKIAGRVSRDDVTIYESLGIALEDLAAAHDILRRAKETGAGTWLDWGGPS